MNEHPSIDILGSEGGELAGKVIILGITGSVAAVRAPDIARKLMRHGAEVHPVMTASACRLVGPELLEWATGHRPVTELTGRIEHVALAGNVPRPADLFLIAPATANTISKIACGIDDTPVTTFATTAFGEGLPLVLVPAMHRSMYDHPFVRDNLRKLEDAGVTVLMGELSEGKAKIAGEEEIFRAVVSLIGPKPMAGRHVVITAGRTVEYLDPIRVITNNSSGLMGTSLAHAALDLGARVTLIYGKGSVPAPRRARLVSVETADEMRKAVRDALREKPDVLIAAAAVGDWKPAESFSRKIPTSEGRLTIELVPTPKIIDEVKALSPSTFLAAFRAQSGLGDDELEADARARMLKAGADLIAVNDTARPGEGFEAETNALLVLTKDDMKFSIAKDSKLRVARKLLAIILERL